MERGYQCHWFFASLDAHVGADDEVIDEVDFEDRVGQARVWISTWVVVLCGVLIYVRCAGVALEYEPFT